MLVMELIHVCNRCHSSVTVGVVTRNLCAIFGNCNSQVFLSRLFMVYLSLRRQDIENLSTLLAFCDETHQSTLGSPHKEPMICRFDALFVVTIFEQIVELSGIWDVTLMIITMCDYIRPPLLMILSRKLRWSGYMYRADSRFAPSQWETALLCNDVSHWLDASLESTLYVPLHVLQLLHVSAKNWAPSQYKDGLPRCGNFHYKYKTVVRPSYLYNGNSYTGKTTSLYWDEPLVSKIEAPLYEELKSLYFRIINDS